MLKKKTIGVRVAALLLVIFLIVFPKGGIKSGSVPLTWGYALLGIMLPISALGMLLRSKISIKKSTLTVFVVLVPFQLMLLYSLIVNGIGDMGFALSTILSFVILPVEFLLLFPQYWEKLGSELAGRWIRRAVFAVAVYGIFLVFWHSATDHYIEVPYLTVNAADGGTLESAKYNDRGGYFKLISTYNNGNLYGVATIILLPLFDVWEKQRWKKLLVRLALVLTLSRTVWAGIILDQLIGFAGLVYGQTRRTTREGMKKTVRIGGGVALAVLAVAVTLYASRDASRFEVDSNLAGRGGEILPLSETTLLPSVPVIGLGELVYVTSLNLYGVIGLFGMLLILGSPVFLYAYTRPKSPISKAAYKGLVLYALLAVVDGAMLLIPVMAFYWFTYMVALQEDQKDVVVMEPVAELEYVR